MSNGDRNSTGGLPGVLPTDDSDAVASQKENGTEEATQETLEVVCPYCRRAWPKEAD